MTSSDIIPGNLICNRGHIVRVPEEREDCPYCRRERKMKPDPRAVKKIHHWKFGHDPADDDTTPESGWTYLTLDRTAAPDSEPDQRDQMASGGPESGLPCWRCHEMTRIVAEKKPSEILVDTFTFGKEKAEALDSSGDTIYLLACPRCYAKMQMRKSMLERLRASRKI